jgi:hypothetical protein
MKRLLVILAMVVALAGLMAASAQADITYFSIIFDEWGHGFVSVDGGAYTPSPGAFGTSPDGYANALYYTLPEPVTAGFVTVWEDSNETAISDVLRFANSTQMWFYSDPAETEELNPPPADLSETNWDNLMTKSLYNGDVYESGIEGKFTWITGVAPYTATYIGYSDVAVPEPCTIILLGSGLAGLGLLRLRKRVQA